MRFLKIKYIHWLLLLASHCCVAQNSLTVMAVNTQTSSLHKQNLAGEGMKIIIYEPAVPLLVHEQFEKRASMSGAFINTTREAMDHATHVGGIILSGGINGKPRGMAYKAAGHFRPVESDLADATDPQFKDMLISNHAYFFNTQVFIPDPVFFGLYDDDAKKFDAAMYRRPSWLPVVAAGNAGLLVNKDPMQVGYDQIYAGLATAKNSLTVANAAVVNRDPFEGGFEEAFLRPSSSAGPTDDYRIKPDITGFGTDIEAPGSTTPNAYIRSTGTSMATANVSGTLLLLQEYYKTLNKKYMLAATLKGLVLHSATLMNTTPGQVGPDARSGWGLLDAKFAADAIAGNGVSAIIEERTLLQDQEITKTVRPDRFRPFQVSISWTDPEGEVPLNPLNSPIPVVINDLDLRVYRKKDRTEYRPYVLTSASTVARADNDKDPYERIDVTSFIMANEEFEIVVSHKGRLKNDSQDFSLIITWLASSDKCLAAEAVSYPVIRSQNVAAGHINNSSEITGLATTVNEAASHQIHFEPGTFIHHVKSVHAYIDNCSEGNMSSSSKVSNQAEVPAIQTPVFPSAAEIIPGGFKVYPIPASSEIIIEVPGHSPKGWVDIIDGNGNVVLRQRVVSKETRLKTANRSSGIYFLQVKDNKGKKVFSKSIMVIH